MTDVSGSGDADDGWPTIAELHAIGVASDPPGAANARGVSDVALCGDDAPPTAVEVRAAGVFLASAPASPRPAHAPCVPTPTRSSAMSPRAVRLRARCDTAHAQLDHVGAAGVPVDLLLAERLRETGTGLLDALRAALSPAASAWLGGQLVGSWIHHVVRDELGDAVALAPADRAAAREVLQLAHAVRCLTAAVDEADPATERVTGIYTGRQTSGRWHARGIWHALPAGRGAPLTDSQRETVAAALLDGAGLPTVAGRTPAELVVAMVRPAMLAAPRGRVLVVADWRQIEARIVRWLAGEAWSDGDPYISEAARIGSTDRALGKLLVLSTQYGATAETVARMAAERGVDLASVGGPHAVLRAWRAAHPGIAELAQRYYDDATRTRAVTLPSGRRIDLARVELRHAGQVLAFVGQGTGADLLDVAVAELHRGLAVVYTLHDSVYLETAEADAEAARDALRAAMTAVPPWAAGLRLDVEPAEYRRLAPDHPARWAGAQSRRGRLRGDELRAATADAVRGTLTAAARGADERREFTLEAPAPAPVWGVAAELGSGKTRAALETVARIATERPVLLTAPSHALADELEARLREVVAREGIAVEVTHLHGQEKHCRAEVWERVAPFAHLGRSQTCRLCPHKDECEGSKSPLEALARRAKPERVIVAAHALLPTLQAGVDREVKQALATENALNAAGAIVVMDERPVVLDEARVAAELEVARAHNLPAALELKLSRTVGEGATGEARTLAREAGPMLRRALAVLGTIAVAARADIAQRKAIEGDGAAQRYHGPVRLRLDLPDVREALAAGCDRAELARLAYEILVFAEALRVIPLPKALVTGLLGPHVWPRAQELAHLAGFIDALAGDGGPAGRWALDVEPTAAHVVHVARATPLPQIPTVILDGTAAAERPVYEAALGARLVELVEVAGADEADVLRVQVPGQTFCRTALVAPGGEVRPDALERIGRLVAHVAPDLHAHLGERERPPRVLLVSCKPVVDLVADDEAPAGVAWALAQHGLELAGTLHHGAARGFDGFREHDVVLVVGDYRPNVAAAEQQAAVLGIAPDAYALALSRVEVTQELARLRAVQRPGAKLAYVVAGDVLPTGPVWTCRPLARGRPHATATEGALAVARWLVVEFAAVSPALVASVAETLGAKGVDGAAHLSPKLLKETERLQFRGELTAAAAASPSAVARAVAKVKAEHGGQWVPRRVRLPGPGQPVAVACRPDADPRRLDELLVVLDADRRERAFAAGLLHSLSRLLADDERGLAAEREHRRSAPAGSQDARAAEVEAAAAFVRDVATRFALGGPAWTPLDLGAMRWRLASDDGRRRVSA